MKILFGIFLILHALIHSSFVSPKPPQTGNGPQWPFDITRSWILTPMGLNTDVIKTIGTILVIAATAGFVLSGLGWLGLPLLKTFWIPITVFSAIASTLLVVIFWHNWFVAAPLINALILYLIYVKDWKPF